MNDKKVCCICGREFIGWGNNPWPVNKEEDTYCCDDCDMMFVLPARIKQMHEAEEKKNG